MSPLAGSKAGETRKADMENYSWAEIKSKTGERGGKERQEGRESRLNELEVGYTRAVGISWKPKVKQAVITVDKPRY